jgi:SAM-dependent methyltransferase
MVNRFSMSKALQNARRAWRRWRFVRNGMKPWKTGYLEYKDDEIARVLRDGSFSADELPAGYGFRLDERIIEYPWLFSRLPMGEGWLLDAGSTLNFQFLLEQPALQQKKVHICTLAPESRCFSRKGVSYVYDDLRCLPYRDDLFDWIVCLSTIEHVGMDNALYTGRGQHADPSCPDDYLVALLELKRVLKPGGAIYITAPFGKAANHRWFQVFDHEMVRSLIRNFAPVDLNENYFLYRAEGWQKCAPEDAATATIFDIHSARDYDADFAAAARAVFCLEMKK